MFKRIFYANYISAILLLVNSQTSNIDAAERHYLKEVSILPDNQAKTFLSFFVGLVNVNSNGLVENTPFCGGSIITERHVLTAAHCFQKPNTVMLSLLNANIELDSCFCIVESFFQHPEYDEKTKHNDIGIVKSLCDFTKYSDISPVLVNTRSDLEFKNALILGFGNDNINRSSAHKAFLGRIINETPACLENYQRYNLYFNVKIHYCSLTSKQNAQPFKGFSGGPLFVCLNGQIYVLGIISSSDDVTETFQVTYYTKTSEFIEYIKSIIYALV